MVERAGFSLGTALLSTLALLFLMQALIRVDQVILEPQSGTRWVEFVHVKEEPDVIARRQTPTPPEVPEEAPEAPRISLTARDLPSGYTELLPGPGDPLPERGGFGLTADGGYLPIARVQPIYPRRALSLGLVGWVIVEFTVTRNGSVRDPYVIGNCAAVAREGAGTACEGHPSSVFDNAAIDAVLKFRYKPRVVNGEPLETSGVRNLFTFRLEE